MPRRVSVLPWILMSFSLAIVLVWGLQASSPPGRLIQSDESMPQEVYAPGRPVEWYVEHFGKESLTNLVDDTNPARVEALPRSIVRGSFGGAQVAACFAPGTPPEVVDLVHRMIYDVENNDPERYNITGRWSGTSGSPRALTWSFVPDGVTIPSGVGEPSAPSDLFASMDAKFAASGGRTTWVNRFQQCFDRWAQLGGVSYTRITVGGNDWDDGAAWGSAGSAGLRGDVRISMKPIDGSSNILAYNNFPSSGGDMVLDSAENWASGPSATIANRFLRNVVAHEHGHGLGILHVCPATSTKLMEPFLATNYDGPRHDDIRALQRHYGDKFEDNNSVGAASNLGVVVDGSPLTVGTVPPPVTLTAPANSSTLSIDADGENDYYRFTVNVPVTATITVTPVGETYFSDSQSGSSCPTATNSINSLTVADLNLQVIDSNGVTVLATAASQPLGVAESVVDVSLPAAGDYYIRVYEGNTFSQSQLYLLSVAVTNACVGPSVDPLSPDATACGSPYTGPTPSAGGTGPFTWSLVNGPLGMTIDSGTGIVSWPNPLTSGVPYTVTIEASNGCGSDQSTYNLTVRVGDFDGDGLLTPNDIQTFTDHLTGVDNSRPCAADVNGDTLIDGLDVAAWVDQAI